MEMLKGENGKSDPSCHWGTPWTSRQSITEPHRDTQSRTLTLTPRDSLESI